MYAVFALALMLVVIIATRGVVESLPHLRGGAYGGAGVALVGHASKTASPTSIANPKPKPKSKPQAGINIKQSKSSAANGVYHLRGSLPRPHGRSLLARNTNTNTVSTTTEEKALHAFDKATKETEGQVFSPGELELLLTGLFPTRHAGKVLLMTSAWENGDKNKNGEIDRTEFASLIGGLLSSKLPQRRRLLARLPKGAPPKAKAKATPKAQPVNDAPNPANDDDKITNLNDDGLHVDDDHLWFYGDDIFFPKRDDGPGGGKESSFDPPMAPHELATMRISISLLANKLVSLDTVSAGDGGQLTIFLGAYLTPPPFPPSPHPFPPQNHDGNLNSNAVFIETMPQISSVVVRFLSGDKHSAFVTPTPKVTPSKPSISPSPSSGATGTLALGDIFLNLLEADTDNDGLLSFVEFKFALDVGHRGRYSGSNGPRGRGAHVPAFPDVGGVTVSADAALVMAMLAFVELEVLCAMRPRSSTLLPPVAVPALAPAPDPGINDNVESERNPVTGTVEFDDSIGPLPMPPSDDSPNTYYGSDPSIEGGDHGLRGGTRGLDGSGASAGEGNSPIKNDDDKSKDPSAIIPNPVFVDPVAFPVPPREYSPALPAGGGSTNQNPNQEGGVGPKKPAFWPQAPQTQQGDTTTSDIINDGKNGGNKYDPEIVGLAAGVSVLGVGLLFLVPIWVWRTSVEHQRQEVLEKQEQEVCGISAIEEGGGAAGAEGKGKGKVGGYWLDFSGSLDSVRSPLQLKAGSGGAGAVCGGKAVAIDSIPSLSGTSSLQMLSPKLDRSGAGDGAAAEATAFPASGRQYTSSRYQYLTVASTSTHAHMSDVDAAATTADAYLV